MTQLVAASDPRFRFEGRFDFTDRASPVLIWQSSRIAIDFEDDELVLEFGPASGQCFFDAAIDGRESLVELVRGAPAKGISFAGLGPGRHTFTLFKRSEADAGVVAFRGIRIARGARVFAPAEKSYAMRLQFFGDSITAGACNEDGAVDQWETRATHNAARSYAAMTAAAFSADHRNIAISGMGIVTGYVEIRAGEFWDRIYPSATSPRADLGEWLPDVVFLNLGENDDSFTRSMGRIFPGEHFTRGMVALMRSMRAAWPKAQIVVLRGGMFGGSQSEPLRRAWESAVTEMEASDRAVAHFVFKHWSENHPRVSDDRAMADELIGWLRRQSFMRR